MGNISLQGHGRQKKILCLYNFPDSQPCVLVNILLKKNRHVSKIQDYFAPAKIEKRITNNALYR
jgi:hypothetical protein